MKKLKLDPDTLAVATFSTGDPAGIRGTLRGHDAQASGLCLTGTETVTCPVVGTCLVCAAER